MEQHPKITFSTCFYVVNSKFDADTYAKWSNNFMLLTHTNNFYLVIYTDENSVKYINLENANHKNVHVVIKPLSELHGYKYREKWIRNNIRLSISLSWELNMIWSEKVWFVQETMKTRYFEDTEFYGWCDIGYFRSRPEIDVDISTLIQHGWPNPARFETFDKNKIMYAIVIPADELYLYSLKQLIDAKNEHGLPETPIPHTQQSVSGGFFVGHRDKIDWWVDTYNKRLQLYFEHDYAVKDDQLIIIDCIFTQLSEFSILYYDICELDPWFPFHRFFM